MQFGERQLSSTSGVQQGDPLGPLLFCLAIHSVLERITAECPSLAANAWYLDDGAVAGARDDVLRALRIIEEAGPSRGLYLNAAKSEVWSSGGVVPCALPLQGPHPRWF